MFNIKKSYWNESGKHQSKIEELNKLIPDCDYTDNKFMNLFITMSNFYYRHYNDGDDAYKFKRRIERYVEPFEKELDFDFYSLDSNEYLENLMDKIVLFIKDKDLTYNSIEEDNIHEDYYDDNDDYDD